jgi:UDP-glucoronosyl and UDP-glucosyl transferase
MVPLARALLDRGDEVRWVAAADACARLAGDGFEALPAGRGQVESINEFHRRYPEFESLPPAERPDFMFPRLFGSLRVDPMLAGLLPIARRLRPSLLVHEQGEFAGPIAAEVLGIPHVTHAFGGIVPPWRVAGAGEDVASLWQQHGLAAPPYGGCYEHLYLDIFPPSLALDDADHVPSIQPIRPVAFATAGEDRPPEWVDGDCSAPLVYVTLGTVFNEDIVLIATILRALGGLDVRVVATVGPAGDPAALGAQPDNVHVARYIPQTELLPHCSVVVSHAGSGTFLATLAQGLPQLCVPQAADQFRNAEACVNSGAGLSLQPGTISSEHVIADAVSRLLSEPGFRDAAGLVSKEIEAMPSPDQVAGLLAARWG